MPLILPNPPEASVAALRDALSALSQRGQFGVHAMQRARAEQLTITCPHQVYVLTLEEIRAGASLDIATPASWRYLLEIDHEVVASAETVATDDSAVHMLTHINDGPFVAGTIEALASAERLATERVADLEIRVVHIPALYSMNLWLHQRDSQGSADDTLIAIAPVSPVLEANQFYGPADMVERLAAQARSIPDLSSEDTSGGS